MGCVWKEEQACSTCLQRSFPRTSRLTCLSPLPNSELLYLRHRKLETFFRLGISICVTSLILLLKEMLGNICISDKGYLDFYMNSLEVNGES